MGKKLRKTNEKVEDLLLAIVKKYVKPPQKNPIVLMV